MFTKRISIQLVALFTAVLLFSCKKSDTIITPRPDQKVLWKIKTNNTDSTLFAYTTTGELFKIITTEIRNGLTAYTFMYDPSSRLTEISSDKGLKHQFVYENNRLKLTENYQGSEKISENVFEYTGNKISANILFTVFFRSNEVVTYKPSFKTTYTYNGSNQPEKTTSYSINPATNVEIKISEKVINQYDNGLNPLVVSGPLALVELYEIPAMRNIIKETLYDGRIT